MKEFDVAIIGAGSAGLSARREVAKKTDNYIVIDGGVLGTTCARVGCMPSKVLIQAANDYHRRHKLNEQGIKGAENLSVNTQEVFTHVRKLRDRFVRGVSEGMSNWSKGNLLKSYARFIDEHTLQCGDEVIKAKKIIIATGTTPFIPDILKNHKNYLLTSDEIFEQETIPEKVGVIGLGVIGLELGQALDRLGIKVHGITRSKRLSGITDPVINEYVLNKFEEQMNITFGDIEHVREIDNQLEISVNGKKIVVDKVLLTIGRERTFNRLGLESLGFGSNEVPAFDMQTGQLDKFPHIFIAGDTNGQKQILHEASDEGKIAGYNSVNAVKKFEQRTPLMVTFCDPNIASAGKSFKELTENKIDFEIGSVSFEGQGRSIVKLKEIGLLRVYGDKKTGEILGAQMFGPDAEHIAHLLSWVISMKLTVNKVLSFPFYHPVVEEGLRTALRDLRSKVDESRPDLEVYPME